MLGFLDTGEVDAFADAVVAELRGHFPPEGVDYSSKKAVAKAMKKIDKLLLRVADFARGRSLNVYKKARFGNRIKWALKEGRYPPQFVEAVTEALVTQITVASRRNKGR